MMKRMRKALVEAVCLVWGALFALGAGWIIRRSGMDKADSGPTARQIERSRQLAERLKDR